MSQLNANQFWHGLGQKFGYQEIDDWLNRFLRYCQFKSVSDGHSAPNDKRGQDMLIIRELTTRARLNLKSPWNCISKQSRYVRYLVAPMILRQ